MYCKSCGSRVVPIQVDEGHMYCPSCGSVVKPGLSYCNHCGNELNAKSDSLISLSESPLESIVWAIAVVTIIGLGSTIGLIAVMKGVANINEGMIIAFSLLFCLSFLGVDSFLPWVLWRSITNAKQQERITQQKGLTTKDLDEAEVRILPEPAASVTEHSTRNLEPVNPHHKME